MTKIDAASTDGQAPGVAHASTLPTIVTVGEILDRRVPLEWFESVAIVAGLCSTLAETGATSMPAPSDVTLSPEGAVLIAGDRGKHNLVALPRLLHELLSVTTPPTPLRLLVLHTISTEGDKSPRAFGAALAYYERPGRDALIKSARQRFLATPAGSEEPDQPKPSEMLDVEPAAPPAASANAMAPRRRRAHVLAAALVAAVALAGVIAAQTRGSETNIFTHGWHSVQVAAARVADAGRSLAQVVTGQRKPGTNAPDDAKPTPDAAPTTDRPRPRSHKGRPQVAESLADSLGDAPDAAEVAPGIDARVEPLAWDPAPVFAGERSSVTRVESDGTEAPADDDATIVPPRLLDPIRLPSWAHTSETPSPNGVIELDIAETGTVRRVRLVSPATSLTDMMILSAAKTWIFEPASSGGRAIPYRLSLNWVPPNR